MQDLRVLLPPGHCALADPILLQATTAIANLAIVTIVLGKGLSSRGPLVCANVERLILRRIAADQRDHRVDSILKFDGGRWAWFRKILACPEETKLLAVLWTVYHQRIAAYQNEFNKRRLYRPPPEGFNASMGFFAKQWWSEISGIPITSPDDLSEDGFQDAGLGSHYFAAVMDAVYRLWKLDERGC
jgi:hypothetical protein